MRNFQIALVGLALLSQQACYSHYVRKGTFGDAETTSVGPFYSDTTITTRNFNKCVSGRQGVYADAIGMCRNEELTDTLLGDAETAAVRTGNPSALGYGGLGGYGFNGLGIGGGLSAVGGPPIQTQMMQLATGQNPGGIVPIQIGGGIPAEVSNTEKNLVLDVDALKKQSAQNAFRFWCIEHPKDERCRDE